MKELICRKERDQSAVCRQTRETANADLSASLVNVVDGLDRVQVVDSGVKANLVHNDDASLLDLWLELLHRIRDVRGGDHVLLVLDGGLDDIDVVDVGDERDDKIVLGNQCVERGRVLDVDLLNLDLAAELRGKCFCVGERSGSCGWSV